jgi:hypothetical protein
VACGANPWIAVFDYSLDHNRTETIKPINDIFGFLAETEPYYTATESAAEVAVLYSRQSATYYVSHLDDLYQDRGSGREQHLVADLGSGKKIVDWNKRKQISDNIYGGEFAGWCLALSRQHIPYDVILDSHLTLEQLNHYKVVVLPDSACLSDEQAQACAEWWIKKMFLSGWAIRVRMVTLDDIGSNRWGENEIFFEESTCDIRLLKKEYCGDMPVKHCAEEILVHELLHCKNLFASYSGSDPMLEALYMDKTEHNLLEKMAKTLIMIKYDLPFGWFKNY